MPDIFTHPVWVHFGDQNKLVSTGNIANLLNDAKQLQDDDPDSACQVLLLCAVYQNYAGQRAEALRTLQQIMSLSDKNRLVREAVWATWGACAVCVQDGDFGQATRHLKRLEALLQEQNDWILVDFIEMVEQALVQKDAGANFEPSSSDNPAYTGLMYVIFEWLQHWGVAAQVDIPEFRAISSKELATPHQVHLSEPFLSSQRWRRYWRTLNQVLKGELRLQWIEQNVHGLTNPTLQHQAENPGLSSPQQYLAPIITTTQLNAQVCSPGNGSEAQEKEEKNEKTSLFVYCLGPFQVYKNDQLLDKWPGNKCRQILKYLVIHFNAPVNQEVLMELFWPGMDAKSARRNLYQAIYNLRQALENGDNSYSYILTEGNNYRLNPDMKIWIDSEAFDQHYQTAQKLLALGRHVEAVQEFEIAENLYQGEFLAEDRYEDWPLVHRENLKNAYLTTLDQLGQYFYANKQYTMSMHYCHKILREDNCREDVHRRVMMCYMNLDQPHLALRQYYVCVQALRAELDVPPMPATEELYKQIQQKRQK